MICLASFCSALPCDDLFGFGLLDPGLLIVHLASFCSNPGDSQLASFCSTCPLQFPLASFCSSEPPNAITPKSIFSCKFYRMHAASNLAIAILRAAKRSLFDHLRGCRSRYGVLCE